MGCSPCKPHACHAFLNHVRVAAASLVVMREQERTEWGVRDGSGRVTIEDEFTARRDADTRDGVTLVRRRVVVTPWENVDLGERRRESTG